MYQITCDDQILHDVRLENRIVLSPVLDLEVEKNGTLTFTIPIQNELYNSILQKKSIIKVYQIDKINNITRKIEIFRGTVYSENIDFWKRKKIECEGELSFLNDTVVRPYTYQGDVETLFNQFMSNHNNQVDNEKRFYPRNFTVENINNYTSDNKNYPTTKEELNNKLIKILGGHFETGNNEDGTRFIDYLLEYKNIASQTIEFGKNLLDITQCIKSEDVATRIIPLGKKNEETGEYLTISSINNGKDYIQDDAAIALFGVIEKVVIYEDETLADNLLINGEKALNDSINKTVSIQLNASDLHNLDVNIENFKIGENVRVISKPHSLDRYFLLSKLHLTLDNTSSCSMNLGATFKSFTEKQMDAERKFNSNITTASIVAQETNKQVKKLDNQVQKINEFIEIESGEYVKTSTFENYKQEINQKLFGVYKIKGSIDTYEDLLEMEDNQVGDVYNILDTGANYVWTDEEEWDKLSEIIDLNEYLKTEDADNTFTKTTDFEDLIKRVEVLENGGNLNE